MSDILAGLEKKRNLRSRVPAELEEADLSATADDDLVSWPG